MIMVVGKSSEERTKLKILYFLFLDYYKAIVKQDGIGIKTDTQVNGTE